MMSARAAEQAATAKRKAFTTIVSFMRSLQEKQPAPFVGFQFWA
jgi:hypothetical protein